MLKEEIITIRTDKNSKPIKLLIEKDSLSKPMNLYEIFDEFLKRNNLK